MDIMDYRASYELDECLRIIRRLRDELDIRQEEVGRYMKYELQDVYREQFRTVSDQVQDLEQGIRRLKDQML